MRETEEKKNIVEQVSLKKWPNDGSMGNIHQLKDISMRPKLGRGRRTNGTLQMHKNGLRFRYVQKLKIMKNVVNCVTRIDCNYRYSNFVELDSSFNVLYRVISFRTNPNSVY